MAARKLSVLAVSIGVTGVLVAACTDKPNRGLNDYETQTATHSASRTSPSASPSTPVRNVRAVRRDAVLRADDVRGEGVRKAQARGNALPGCLADTAGRDRAEPAAAWRYPTGSELSQYVLRGRLPSRGCGTPLPGGLGRGGAPGTAWCTHGGCGVAFAERGTVSAIWVATPRRRNAAQAVRRLAPVLAERLSAG